MYSDSKIVSKEIRKMLKQKFPNTKFSVTKRGCETVYVGWDDYPCSEAVDKLLRQFEYGSFDVMNDIYDNDNVIKDVPQCKFIITQQSLSDESIERGKKELIELYKRDIFLVENNEFANEYGRYKEQFISRYIINKMKNNEW